MFPAAAPPCACLDRHIAACRRHSGRVALAAALLVAACSSRPIVVDRGQPAPPAATAPARSAPPKPPGYVLKHGGGFYQDDGPGDNPPVDIEAIADAVPRSEPLHRFANNPYSVLGRDYVPQREVQPFRQRGVASWYGRKFHGQKTASGDTYDMYGMTAAHPTLPIPSYARITNPASGKSVVVRVNDRGPFHADRIVDLSYSAAWKLGLVDGGSGLVELQSVAPGAASTAPMAAGAPLAADDDAIARLVAGREAPPLPEFSDRRGTWLQLGAFGSRDNADSLKARLASELAALGDKLVVRAEGNWHRVQLGPYRDAAEARRVAVQVRAALDTPPLLINR